MITVTLLGILALTNEGHIIGVIHGPKAGVLAKGESIVVREQHYVEDIPDPVIIELRRGSKILGRASSEQSFGGGPVCSS